MLNGNLDAFALPDVLRFIAGSGVTGRIEITREEVAGEFALDQGRFVGTRLGEDEAPTTVDEALDVAVLLFDGSGGTFELVEEEWVGGPLSLDAGELTAAVEKRRQEWAAVIESLGSLEDALVLANDLPEGTDQITIRAAQWRLLTLVDGNRSVQDIARDSASSVYATALALSELAAQGMVARGAGVQWRGTGKKSSKKAQAVEPDPDPSELLRELGADGGDDGDGEDAEPERPQREQRASGARATVRPLRAPTREEQRIRLRR